MALFLLKKKIIGFFIFYRAKVFVGDIYKNRVP